VVPDILNVAKQITNGAIPMGAVIARREIYDTFMAQDTPEHLLEFFHGYTYSAHPVACAAALANLDLLEQEQLYQRVAEKAPLLEEAIHASTGAPHVTDIRNYGFAAAVTLEAKDGDPTRRPFEVAMRMWEKGLLRALRRRHDPARPALRHRATTRSSSCARRVHSAIGENACAERNHATLIDNHSHSSLPVWTESRQERTLQTCTCASAMA
jgi:adenosylmethionine-8-amino-7-oxononanoate aminotransferase